MASAVFFHGPPSYLVVLAADAGILVLWCLAHEVREARSQDNSDSCAIALSWEMTHFALFPIFSRLSRRLRAGVLFFLGPRALTVVSARGPGVPESPGVSLPGDSAQVDCANSSSLGMCTYTLMVKDRFRNKDVSVLMQRQVPGFPGRSRSWRLVPQIMEKIVKVYSFYELEQIVASRATDHGRNRGSVQLVR